ncbi:uncharacterized protein [Onthophagus taurus]|uniref:uncharacterized protein n=1 Tax=Onthophagus taurus TaxID=166361 RepID=UPI000C20F52B|nr:uncharacterized protein LOC111426098 [Onthophagus taurus]
MLTNNNSNNNQAYNPTNPDDRNFQKCGRVFTGTVERVMKWNRIYSDFCYYEVIASVIAFQDGPNRSQRTMLLRDRQGPILQVIYYSNDRININDFFVGETLRCLGHMTSANTLHALSIRVATNEELTTLQRMVYISEHAMMSCLEKK